LVVLVIVMGLLIVVGTVIVANEMSRRLSSAAPARAPAPASATSGPTGTPFTQRIELPAGAQVISMTAVGDRLVVQVETQAGLTAAYVVDPRTGALLGTIEFPPGVPR
jgi:hypothetical protein